MDGARLDPRTLAMLERNLQAVLDGREPEALPPTDICELYRGLLALEERLRQARQGLTDRLFEAAAAARRRHAR